MPSRLIRTSLPFLETQFVPSSSLHCCPTISSDVQTCPVRAGHCPNIEGSWQCLLPPNRWLLCQPCPTSAAQTATVEQKSGCLCAQGPARWCCLKASTGPCWSRREPGSQRSSFKEGRNSQAPTVTCQPASGTCPEVGSLIFRSQSNVFFGKDGKTI